MLEFFRQYQKYFFIVIATVVISSFVFFGTSGALNSGPVRSDRVIGKGIDGSDLMLSEIASLSRFIAADQDDILSGSRNVPPNLLNDGVIRRDILGAGVAEVLVSGNYDALKSELEQRIQRVKTYRSYEHPETPFLSAKAVWQRFNPAINTTWSLLQSEQEMTAASFAHLVSLYQLQSGLPAEWLRRILMMQEQQYNWLRPDPRLRQGDMALFGFHSLTDWFGKNFVDLTAEFIHNAALAAEEKGYKATLAEAKADLQRNFSEAVKKLQAAKVPIELSYKDQLRILGMDETEAATVWRKILLFRRYFADLGNSVFLDRMAHSEFSSIAGETAVIDLYQWPSILTFKNAYNLYAFQTYLKSVAVPEKGDALALPKAFLSVQEIEKKAPELLTIPYKAKVFAVDKREIALRAPLKEVWAFETEDGSWGRLKAEFPDKLGAPTKNSEERFAILESLDPVTRAKIDAFARILLIDQHAEWVTQALDAAQGEEKQLSMCAGKIELPYVDDPARLGKIFAQIPESPEVALIELGQFASKTAFFRFENIEKLSDARIKTFQEAMHDHSLPKLVDKELEAEFPKIRSALPEDQSKKEFAGLKEETAEALLGSLKKQLSVSLDQETSFIPRRMGLIAARALQDLQKDANDPQWICSEGEDPLFAQFKMQRTEKQISRTAKEDWMSKESFILIPDQWSPIHVADDGDIMFMYLKTRQVNKEPIMEQLFAGRQVLASDVQKVVAQKILTVMQNKQAVIIPLQPEQE
jgi:hypothetical protein